MHATTYSLTILPESSSTFTSDEIHINRSVEKAVPFNDFSSAIARLSLMPRATLTLENVKIILAMHPSPIQDNTPSSIASPPSIRVLSHVQCQTLYSLIN